MFRLSSVLRWIGVLVLAGGLVAVAAVGGVYWHLAPNLPSINVLKDVRLQLPLRVYTRDGLLMAEFGEKRRNPLTLEEIPQTMIDAMLASEDERFYEHPGVDWQGLTRAVLHLVRTGEKGPGGSTITMQVARNFFLGREKTYVRKLNEILLALKIEQELGKDEILELYFNKIFLGHRAYGVGAAGQVYYGAPLEELSLPQLAMIAGLPKAPSRFNPIVNPERAVERRSYVLGRMHQLGYIDRPSYEAAAAAPVSARLHGLAVEVAAPYAAELVRADMEARVGDEAYTAGYRAYTTVQSRLQRAANEALRGALTAYDRRHGYRGPELHVESVEGEPGASLADLPVVAGLVPALVTGVDEQVVTVLAKGVGEVEIAWPGLEWARPYVNENRAGKKPKTAADVVSVDDLVRVQLTEDGWRLAQVPDVEGALVALDPEDGAILALTGGFDFYRSKFNRAVQAERQPGSSFKPFIYSAALSRGFTAASLINDAPVVFDDPSLETDWRPENYSGKFFGPTRLRVALYKSRNLVSIRLLEAVGIEHGASHILRFGFDPERLPRNLSLALGSLTVSPLELARAYAVIANGGFLIEPYLVERVIGADGSVLLEAAPLRVCRRQCEEVPAPAASPPPAEADVTIAPEAGTATAAEAQQALSPPPRPLHAPRVVDPQNIWVLESMMRDVIRRGTGRKARALERKDLAGKTGTTNDQRDAWFSGFNSQIVATAWVGFDKLEPLGRRETGGRAALPMWIDFMRVALDGMPELAHEQPEGLVTMRIDPGSGQAASANDPDAIFEVFRVEHAPVAKASASTLPETVPVAESSGDVTENLF